MTSSTAAEEIQRLAMDPAVELFEVDASELFGDVLRFTPSPLVPDPAVPVPQPVTWRGELYAPRPCQASGWSYDGLGPLPTPTIKLGNTDLAISALCIGYGDLLGVPVTRHRTWRKYLDGMPDADPDVELDPDIYRIERKVSQNGSYVEFQLGTAIDVEGRLIPGRSVLQGYCSLRYRAWDPVLGVFDYAKATCPYAGAAYFRADGTTTANPAEDRCAKRLGLGCAKRFPGEALPFGGFPGVARYRSS